MNIRRIQTKVTNKGKQRDGSFVCKTGDGTMSKLQRHSTVRLCINVKTLI
jgi:hypothetical protein